MIRRLLAGYLSITLFILFVLEIPLGISFARLQRNRLIADVQHDAATIALFAEPRLEARDAAALQQIAGAYRLHTKGRVVIVDNRGILRADSASQGTPVAPNDFSNRPEIVKALRGDEAHGLRHSKLLGKDLLYVAVPMNSGGVVQGAVRITYPSSVLAATLVRSWALLAGLAVLILAVVIAVSFRLARSLLAPLHDLERAAARLGEGDLGARAEVPHGPRELTVLAQEFNATASKLARLVDSQAALVADVSHQLRTPLAALRLRLEMLERDIPGRAHEDFEAALAEVHRLSRLVDGLLMLARAENRPSAREITDVSAVVAGRRAAWLPLAEERQVDIVIDGGSPAYALATPGNLEQVLDNLIANAIDFSPEHTAITMRMDASPVGRDGGWTTVHVTDQGPGMSPERRHAAFDRFWKAGDSEGTIGGFGLGLAIVRRLVVADRGEVELLEANGGGLDVCVRLAAAVPTHRRPLVVRDGAGQLRAPAPSVRPHSVAPSGRSGQLVSR